MTEQDPLAAVYAKVSESAGTIPSLIFYDGAGTLFFIDETRDGITGMDDRQLSLLSLLASHAQGRIEEERGKRP